MDQLIHPDWLQANLDEPDLRVLDCTVLFERIAGVLHVESGRAKWAEGHLPGSNFVDLVCDLSDQTTELRFMMPPASQVASVMESVGVGDGTRVVLYDADKNMWAARVWWMLRSLGFDSVGVLDGGLNRWTAEGYSLSTGPASEPPTARFVVRPRPGFFVDKGDVVAAIDDKNTCVINALSAEQHNGENDDYGRRGHIPGAINVPAVSLVDADTHAYLNLDTLREIFSPALASGPGRTITYCGGGIAAASNLFALRMLGVENVAIYDASMSEWGCDYSLPLTVESSG